MPFPGHAAGRELVSARGPCRTPGRFSGRVRRRKRSTADRGEAGTGGRCWGHRPDQLPPARLGRPAAGRETPACWQGAVLAHRLDRPLTAALDCDEGGPPRWDARRVTEKRVQGGPSSCCTLGWI